MTLRVPVAGYRNTFPKQIWHCCSIFNTSQHSLPFPCLCTQTQDTYTADCKSLALSNNLSPLYLCNKNHVVFFFHCLGQTLRVWLVIMLDYISILCLIELLWWNGTAEVSARSLLHYTVCCLFTFSSKSCRSGHSINLLICIFFISGTEIHVTHVLVLLYKVLWYLSNYILLKAGT